MGHKIKISSSKQKLQNFTSHLTFFRKLLKNVLQQNGGKIQKEIGIMNAEVQ